MTGGPADRNLGPLRRFRSFYDSEPALRAAVESIPSIGPVLGALLSGDRRALIEERFALFLEDLRSEVEKIVREAGVNEQVIRSQGYADLMILAVESAGRSRHEEKRRLYARILARRASLGVSSDEQRAEEIMQALGDLSLTELSVLRAVVDAQAKSTQSPGIWPESLTKATGLTEDDVTAYCARLQRTGFVVVKPTNQITIAGKSPIPIQIYPMPLLADLIRLIGEGGSWRSKP
jgi:DNA-binding MarR family transcriptional regulator